MRTTTPLVELATMPLPSPNPIISCLIEIQTGFTFSGTGLPMDMWFKATKSWHRKFEPRVRVWKLKEEKTCEEYRRIVGDKVEEAKWKGLGVNDHWQQKKGIIMETAQDICGMTKGPCRHKETWWWNEDVAEAVREKKIMYGKREKENTKEARMENKNSKQNAKRVISSAKKKKQKECANDLNVKMKFFEWQSRWLKKDRK